MFKNPYAGSFFIAFEGPDGSGQTTQAQLLSDYLRSSDLSVILTKEPTQDSAEGKRIRRILEKKEALISPYDFQLLYIIDREQHLKKLIMPSLTSGKIVITDRYLLSTAAFGGINIDMNRLLKLNDPFIFPNVTFVLDVPVDECIRRVEKRGHGFEYFEKRLMLEKVLENYKVLARRFPSVHLIDGDRTREEVFSDIREIIDGRIFDAAA